MPDATPSPSSNPRPSGSGRRETPAELTHHEMRVLDALELLIESGRAKTVEDLIRYAQRDQQTAMASYLQVLAADRVPLPLAFDALKVQTRLLAHKRNDQLLAKCQGKRVGLVLPLPPLVTDAFSTLTDVVYLIADGQHVPHHVRGRPEQILAGSLAARDAAASLPVLIFEAFAADGQYLVDARTLSVIDLRIIPAETELIVHLRPHRDPDDVPLPLGSRVLNVL